MVLLFGSGGLPSAFNLSEIQPYYEKNLLSSGIVLISPDEGFGRRTSIIEKAFISRILLEKKQWPEILRYACRPELELIISGRKPVRKDVLRDDIEATPPFSFHGKLLAILYKRYTYFAGDAEKGVVIFSREHGNNPELLESILLELAHLNDLEPKFLDWLENANRFYSRLIYQ